MDKIAVIGAGTMGNGITHVFAQNGFQVNICDISQSQLDLAIKTITKNLDRQVSKDRITTEIKSNTLDNITTYTDLPLALADCQLVIEAATENIDLKLDIFRILDKNTNSDCILATNTSSISITKIAAVTSKPQNVIGMHFMNPVPIMKLVEVIRGYDTSDAVAKKIMDLSTSIGKTPVEVNDYPGFVANRVLLPMINEAIHALHEGVGGVLEIDTVMKLGMAHPMGPLQLADFIGLDVCLAILNVIKDGFGNPKYAPCPLLVNMVTAGKLGNKSGEGFYVYRPDSKEITVSDKFILRQ